METQPDPGPNVRTGLVAGVTTFSITQGILWGFITHAGLHTPAGRAREVGPVMYALAPVSAGLLPLERFA